LKKILLLRLAYSDAFTEWILTKESMVFISMRFTTEEFLTRLLLADVRDDQVVSRWDLDTGPTSMLGMFDVNLDRVLRTIN
jgi:hypothetical protein